jgi:mRNA interferase HigB
MRIIARGTLSKYWEHHPETEQPLRAWFHDTLKANWKTPNDIKNVYKNASILGDNRVVFNIKANAYRLIVKVHYNTGRVYVRFIGTHQEYDKIDAETI